MKKYPTESVSIKHWLDQDEKNQMALDLAEKQINISELEDEKKGVVSTFKARIDALTGTVKLLSHQIKDGYVMHTILAEKRRNFETKRWEFYNPETGELAKTEPFQGNDFQMRTDDIYDDQNKTLVESLQEWGQEHNIEVTVKNPLSQDEPQIEEYSSEDPDLQLESIESETAEPATTKKPGKKK